MAGLDPAIAGCRGPGLVSARWWVELGPRVSVCKALGITELVPVPSYGAGLCSRVAEGSGS